MNVRPRPHAKAGKLRVLAVTSAKRTQLAPEIPAVAEVPALAGYEAIAWQGLLAPAATPAPIVAERGDRTLSAAADGHRAARAARLDPVSAQPRGVQGAHCERRGEVGEGDPRCGCEGGVEAHA